MVCNKVTREGRAHHMLLYAFKGLCLLKDIPSDSELPNSQQCINFINAYNVHCYPSMLQNSHTFSPDKNRSVSGRTIYEMLSESLVILDFKSVTIIVI